MARLWSYGAELNSTATEVELDSIGNGCSINSTTKRSGSYAMRLNPNGTTNGQFRHDISDEITRYDITYIRIYLYVVTRPNIQAKVIGYTDGGNDMMMQIDMKTDGSLVLYDYYNGTTFDSSAVLDLNTWYRIELKQDSTDKANVTAIARLNGVQFSTGVSDFTGFSAADYALFGEGTSCTYDWYMDDIAINNTTGSFQNSWPGEGNIVHLKPNDAGDNTQWSVNDVIDHFDAVNEVTPDDATYYILSNTTNQIDDFELEPTPVAIGSNSTINVVHVGARYRGEAASANSAFVVRAKKAAAGTVSESSAITPANTTWHSNANSYPYNYLLTLYQDPNSSAWTKATLDTAQIGVRISTGDTNDAQVSTLWMLVEYIPYRTGVSWQTWSDGVGGIPTVTGDSDWGKISISINEEGRSRVYDFDSFGTAVPRTITLTLDNYEAGQGTGTLQYRYSDTAFAQDDVNPSWNNYTDTFTQSLRYFQIRLTKTS